ncbi:MAG: hypothetical protein JXJ04_03600 [Spirochaetales bacterium]|nr:hypothetical protein [Spirochaetales bacterium]
MNIMKKAEISSILFEYSQEIPIITHLWNDFVLELRIEHPSEANLVKTQLINYCDELLRGVMLIIKWDKGEKVIIC